MKFKDPWPHHRATGPQGHHAHDDESPIYPGITKKLEITHGTVNHSQEEYARAHFWHTNTCEIYFSLLKRGIIGTFHHVSEAHLHRYTAEFDFRYNTRKMTDAERMALSIPGHRRQEAHLSAD